MSTDATTPVPAAPGRSALPQFDATREVPAADATREIPAADTTALPTVPPQPSPIPPPAVPYAYATPDPGQPAAAVPAARAGGDGPRWSAKKTAVTAGLAIVLASAGAIGAAAAIPAGSTDRDTGRFGRFAPGGQNGFTPFGRGNQGFGNQNGQGNQGNQLPGLNGQGNLGNQGSQLPNLGGIDPNQLSQLDPQDLLKQLDQLTGGSDDGSSSTT